MSEFLAFFRIGLTHILYLGGIDHLLFITSVLIIYTIKDWRIVIRLITAFTLGHVVSMGLGYFNAIPMSRAVIEFLIPLTILSSSIYHLVTKKTSGLLQYGLIAIFGLIHGAAYAGEFMSMMGHAPQVLIPLLGFNLGVEVAQLLFGLSLLIALHYLFSWRPSWRRIGNILIFGLISLFAINLTINAWPW